MVQYRLLDSDGLIEEAVRSFASLPAIAVDFEGEFNLHIYGEHLCLVQIYAGGTYYVIDPRSASVTKAGLEAFFSSDVEKVWFECHSDETLVYKSYGLRIRNIYDIRVPAKLLGYDGNLLSLEESLLGIVPSFSKKKNQTANWLRRPIPPEQMEYALADVAHLLELKDHRCRDGRSCRDGSGSAGRRRPMRNGSSSPGIRWRNASMCLLHMSWTSI